MENKKLIEYFEEIETEKEYDGYYYKISEVNNRNIELYMWVKKFTANTPMGSRSEQANF